MSPRREPRWLRIADIPGSDIGPERKIELLAGLLHELGVAQAMVLVHGTKAGAARYAELGGLVRYDGDGEPCIRDDAFTRRHPGIARSG